MHFALNSSGEVRHCSVEGNQAVSLGGGIVVQDHAHPTLQATNVTGNFATTGGGALFSQSARPMLEECHFNDNTALTHGGGIAVSDFSSCTLANCTLSGNRALSGSGGALATSEFSNPDLFMVTMRVRGRLALSPLAEHSLTIVRITMQGSKEGQSSTNHSYLYP